MSERTQDRSNHEETPSPEPVTPCYREDFPVAKDGELLTPSGRRLDDFGVVAVIALFGLLLAVGGLLYQRIGVSPSSGVSQADVDGFAAWGRAFVAVGVALFAGCGLAEAVRCEHVKAELARLGFADREEYRRAFRTAPWRGQPRGGTGE